MGVRPTERLEKAPAKLNLALDTPFHHANGDEEWDMVMTSVDLADYVAIKTLGKNGRIKVTTDSGFLPNDHRNLAYKAAHLLATKFGQREAVNIHIEKHIPVAAGMGGGSSDAAAVLRGLNDIWQLGLTQTELCELGLQIDADVPYCVWSQTAHVTGRGEKIDVLPKLPAMWIVIAKPKISVSTPALLRQVNYEKLAHTVPTDLLTAINAGDYEGICANVANVLTPITARQHPTITHIKEKMLHFGADAAEMSGTGPTVFGLCKKQSRAQHVANGLAGFCREVYVVRPLSLPPIVNSVETM
ncbi:4-(cytidine 5'-diphospho)-2-C-methyl-D-erythritol kinase [Furfurilactobacillus siliginis]|uniref:4-diphosphocytidyl-2-C-methyl-D-erythritol kinase n=2 Tax=Furfurilactobacillus siliginis TaxID=348151 RepID=A0A0R2L2Q3_9LACO|nr:4-(cytidine 5'-diphospho)-2-C-methyl-D-erythritol kinase [Furfurilactobacillus siliginis]KRN95987.1 4-diphosphocytidyl-2-C-methyl-D-erythritol kinase [Furfurilactobacillus siliginis]